jgi:hypothetical protein
MGFLPLKTAREYSLMEPIFLLLVMIPFRIREALNPFFQQPKKFWVSTWPYLPWAMAVPISPFKGPKTGLFATWVMPRKSQTGIPAGTPKKWFLDA